MSSLVESARVFAKEKHAGQTRKGEKQEPYFVHVAEVAHLLKTHGADDTTIAAGYLHDTIEDTGTKYEELKTKFGHAVADIVQECSDDKSLPKAERKKLQAEHAAHKSPQAKQVKMADKISNLRSILTSPPADWNDARKLEYFVWSKTVVDNCRGVNGGLEKTFDDTYAKGIAKFSR